MRKYLILLVALAALLGFGPAPAAAAPTFGGSLASQLKDNGAVQDARVFCYNSYTGRFLHWGPCYRRHYYRPYYRRYYYRPHYWHRRHYHRYYW